MKPRQTPAHCIHALPANSRRPAWRRDLLSPLSILRADGCPPRRVQTRSDAVGVEMRGRFGEMFSTSQSETAGTNSQTPAGRNPAEGGDRRPLPSPLKSVGRRIFFAALGGALAWGAHKRANPTDRHAEPYTGPLTLEHHTPTLVQTHAENSGAQVMPGKLSLTVEYGEPMNIGGRSFREIRGVKPVT